MKWGNDINSLATHVYFVIDAKCCVCVEEAAVHSSSCCLQP